MSVASGKTNFQSWRQWLDYRHYGARGPRAFSLKEKLLYGATSAAARLFLRLAHDACRWTLTGDAEWRHDLVAGRRNFIYLFWHNRIPGYFPYAALLVEKNPQFPLHSIVSTSKDGELMARPIRESGGVVIRGSSSKDATSALRAGVQAARKGSRIATVGDGPRGPRYKLKPGPIMLAKATGLPILPTTWAGSRVAQLHRSWDQMMLPLPFSNVEMRFGEPIHVDKDSGPREIARKRREVEQAMDAMTQWADANTRIAWQIPKPKPGEILKRRAKIELKGRHVS